MVPMLTLMILFNTSYINIIRPSGTLQQRISKEARFPLGRIKETGNGLLATTIGGFPN